MRVKAELTEMEVTCLQLSGRDFTIKQISSLLERSPETIKKHRYHLLQKLGCSTMAGAVMLALQRDILSL